MNKVEFTILTRGALNEIISWASLYLRAPLPNKHVKLVGGGSVLADGTDEVVDYLVSAVYAGPDDIKPCIDLTVVDFDETTVSIMYMPTGHRGRPFGLNWTGTAGPYVKCIDSKLLESLCNKDFPKNWGKNA